MASDTARVRKNDPGNPEICNVFTFHKLFSNVDTVALVALECPRAGLGCFDCKKRLAEAITARVEPLRVKIEDNLAHPERLDEILRVGADRARAAAQVTMAEVREAMKLPKS
jgi:tryptophanyl-tRNA synthetase